MWATMIFCSCFNTRFDDTEEKRLQRIKDSIHTDSINLRRSIPDTSLALYKRTAVCDGEQVLVFDRVQMLSGDEAVEYAKRHKQFGNNQNVLVNQKETLETLSMDTLASIWLIESHDGDSVKYIRGKISDIADSLTAEDLIQIVAQYRKIVYVRQMPQPE